MSGTLSTATVYALCGAAVIGLGLFGFVRQRHLLRRLVAFNIVGSGVFLLFGATGFRTPAAGADPVPQALIVTGIVVALSATALLVALIVRYAGLSGAATLPEETPEHRAQMRLTREGQSGEGPSGKRQPGGR